MNQVDFKKSFQGIGLCLLTIGIMWIISLIYKMI